ncbi:MAG: CHAT domain-containing protein, partial [Nitrospinota bacterium]
MLRYESERVFSLEMARDNGKIKISAYEKFPEDEKTIRHYEFQDICDDEIRKMCAAVVDLLNRTNHHGKIDKKTLKELQTAGQFLYDSLLTNLVKEKLAATNTRHLIVSVDDRLVQIPWELLFDGNSFLCQRFNMGRVVSTSQRISEPAIRKIEKPIKMLIIADPKGDLEASYNEGVRLRDKLDNNNETVEVHLRTSLVDVKFVKGALRDFDVVHYAGHADYDIKNPSNSGFLMENGKLKALDIINMIGAKPLPSLIFSNACKSGHTDMWRVGGDYETEIYGLANAFLLAGVQHYIGTFWDVQDEPSLYFALDFYKELMDGVMVGEAVRKARLGVIERYGEDTIIWASYMLYGDPTVRYVDLS